MNEQLQIIESPFKPMAESNIEVEEMVPFSDIVFSPNTHSYPPEIEIPAISSLYSREVHNPVVEIPIKTDFGRELSSSPSEQVIPTGHEPYFLGQKKEKDYYGEESTDSEVISEEKDAIDIVGEISKKGVDEIERMVRVHGQDFAQRAMYLLRHGHICPSGPQRQEDKGILVYLDGRLNLISREWGLMTERNSIATEYRNGTHNIAASSSVVVEQNGKKRVSYPMKERNTQPQQVRWSSIEARKHEYQTKAVNMRRERQNQEEQANPSHTHIKKWFEEDIRKLQTGHELMQLLGKQIGEMHVRAALAQIADQVPISFRY